MRKNSSLFGGFFGGGGGDGKGSDSEYDGRSGRAPSGSSRRRRRPTNQESNNAIPSLNHSYSSADESARYESRSARMAIANPESDPHRKIKFKRAKKLTKKASVAYMKTAQATNHGRFYTWNKAELVQIMISNGIELRNESSIDSHSLRELCEALYFERDMPARPRLPKEFEIAVMHVRARRIQNFWINYMIRKRQYAEMQESSAYLHRMQMITGGPADGDEEDATYGSYGIGAAELLYMENAHERIVGDQRVEDEADLPALEDLEEGKQAEDADADADAAATAAAEGKAEDAAEGDAAAQGKKRHKKKRTNVLDIPWEPPSVEKAEVFSNYVQPRRGGKGGTKFSFWHTTTGRHCCLGGLGEQFDLWEEGQISEFGIYGAGVTNYFKFIKWCFWMFVVMTVLSLPMLVMNTEGPNRNNSGLQALAQTTAGNLLDNTESEEMFDIRIPACTSYGVYDIQCSLTRKQLSRFYAYLDVIIVLVAFGAFLWLRKFEKIEEIALEKNTVNASMFTIMVSNLPPDVTEEELIEHFGKLCKDKKIASISLAYDNIEEIKECMERGSIIKSKVREVHKHRQLCTAWKAKFSEEKAAKRIEKERESFYETMNKMTTKLKDSEALLAKYAETPANVVYAFITFDKVAGREAALERYHGHSLIYNWLYGKHLQLRNFHLNVQPASEPSTILWENLAYTSWDRFKRRSFTTVLALLLIVVSLFVVFGAEAFDEANSNTVGDDDQFLCPDNFDNMSEKEQQDFVEDNEDLIHCYCDQFTTLEQAQSSFCRSYFQERMQSQILTYFASLIVLIVNIAMEKTLDFFARFELHHTEDGKNLGLFVRMFILKYINTSCVFFINNNPTIIRNVFDVDASGQAEFTAGWFNTVGTTIILVQLGDIFSAHGDKLVKYLKFHWRLARAKNPALSNALTQDDLNRAYTGPSFDFALNYAQFLATIFVCWTFSAGIPLLYLLGAGNFLVTYFIEKYLFMNLYRIPPHFSNNVGKRATALIPYALVLHCGVAIWMFSNPELFENDSQNTRTDDVGGDTISQDIRQRMTGTTTLPLFIVLLFILVARVLTQFFKGTLRAVRHVVEKCLGRIACCMCCKSQFFGGNKKLASAQAVVTYTRAVQRNLIKGLANYNILQNPIYKEKFAITWKFAIENKNVRSVRNMKAKAHIDDEETDAARVAEMQRNIHTVDSMMRKRRLERNRSFASSFYSPPGASGKGSGKLNSSSGSDKRNSGNRTNGALEVDEAPRSQRNSGNSSSRPGAAAGLTVTAPPPDAGARHQSPTNRSPPPSNTTPRVQTSTTPRATAAPASPTSLATATVATAQVVTSVPRGGGGGRDEPRFTAAPIMVEAAPTQEPKRTPRRIHVHRDGTVSTSGGTTPNRRFRHENGPPPGQRHSNSRRHGSSRDRPTSYDSRSSAGSGVPPPQYYRDESSHGRPLPPTPTGGAAYGMYGGAPYRGHVSSTNSVGSDASRNSGVPPPPYQGQPPPYGAPPHHYSPYDRNRYY